MAFHEFLTLLYKQIIAWFVHGIWHKYHKNCSKFHSPNGSRIMYNNFDITGSRYLWQILPILSLKFISNLGNISRGRWKCFWELSCARSQDIEHIAKGVLEFGFSNHYVYNKNISASNHNQKPINQCKSKRVIFSAKKETNQYFPLLIAGRAGVFWWGSNRKTERSCRHLGWWKL